MPKKFYALSFQHVCVWQFTLYWCWRTEMFRCGSADWGSNFRIISPGIVHLYGQITCKWSIASESVYNSNVCKCLNVQHFNAYRYITWLLYIRGIMPSYATFSVISDAFVLLFFVIDSVSNIRMWIEIRIQPRFNHKCKYFDLILTYIYEVF